MNTETQEPFESQTAPPPRRLVRPVTGRSIAGVASGLSEYLRIPVGWVRFAFLAAIVFGGFGFVAYIAGWLLIRDETENESIAQRMFDQIGSSHGFGIVLVVVAAIIVLDNLTFMPGSLIWAVVLVTVGILLYRGDIRPGTASEGASDSTGTVPPRPESRPVVREEPPPAPPGGAKPTPSPPPGPPPPPPPPPSILGRLTLGIGLVALGVLAVLDNVTSLIDPQPRHYLALATVVLGLGLLTGAFIGRARWMILLGVFLVPPLVVSPATEVNWEGDLQRMLVPVSFDTFDTAYRSSAASYHFDLRQADWDGQTIPLEVDLAAGEIVIVLPEDVALTGQASVGIGAIEAPDGDVAGVGGNDRSFDLPGEQGTLDIDLDVGAGVVEIYQGSDPGIPSEPPEVRLGPGVVTMTERNR